MIAVMELLRRLSLSSKLPGAWRCSLLLMLVWEVAASRLGLPVLGTASADQTARIWGQHSAACLLQYQGHQGSVNSLRFHPSKELALTTSGDGTAHIWQCAVNLHNESSSGRVAAGSQEDLEFIEEKYEERDCVPTLRTPLQSLAGQKIYG